MAYKKYITKNGKIYGPYIYHSRRVNGKVISEYRGPKTNSSSKKIILPIIISIFILGIIIAIFSLNSSITAQATLDLTGTYNQNLPLSGNLNFNLKQGELIPADSKVIFEQEDIKYEFLLNDLISQDPTQGDFYIEDFEITGEGEGFGLMGSKKEYPLVYFKLNLITNKETTETSSETPIESKEEIPEQKNETPIESKEEILEAPTEYIEKEIFEITPETTIVQEELETPIEPLEEKTEIEETPLEEEPETSIEPEKEISEPSPEIEEPESTITGNIIKGITGTLSNFFLGLTPTGQVSLNLEEEIQGDVSYENPFEYSLKNKQTIELIDGTVKTEYKELSKDVLEISQEDKILNIKTNYSEEENGFGEEYLEEEEIILSINLSELNLLFNEGDLKISFVYQEQEFISLETTLKENVSIETKTEPEIKEPELKNETIIINETIEFQEIQNLSIEEIEILKENLPTLSEIKRTAKEYKEWILIKFTIGIYEAEFSYDKELPGKTLEYLIEKDRINWLKDLANQFSEEKASYEDLENLTKTYEI